MDSIVRSLFSLWMLDNVSKGFVYGELVEQCKSLIVVNNTEFDNDGILGSTTWWDSDGNLYPDERYFDIEAKSNSFCYDPTMCYHFFIKGNDDFRIFMDDKIVYRGRFHEDGHHIRVGNCPKKSECGMETEIFVFAIEDYSFSLKNSEGMVDEDFITDHEARVYCLDPTDCYELRGIGNGYYSESQNNAIIDQGDAKYKRFGSGCALKCLENPLLVSSDRGRDISAMLGYISGMQSLSDVQTPEYKAACWLIHDDPRQLQVSNHTLIQRYILALLYHTTNGPSWDNKHQFLSPLSECEWHNIFNQGVFCNESGNVTKIHLNFNEMEGTIITEINRLSALEHFAIKGNRISGSIPSQLDYLHLLKYLDLSSNQLSGTMSSFSNIKSLEILDLGYNQLTGSISTFIGNLMNLDISHNLFNGTISSSIGNLKNLMYLKMKDNILSGTIPTSITNLSKLKHYRNNLKGTIPSQLFLISSLEFVYLSRNNLTGGIPTEVVFPNSLKVLDLSDLSLNGTISSTISTLSHLRFLDLSNNSLIGQLSPTLSNLRDLGSVPFENCTQFSLLYADCIEVVCKCCAGRNDLYPNPPRVLGCAWKEIGVKFFDIGLNDVIYFTLENGASQILLQENEVATYSKNKTYSTCFSPTDCLHLTLKTEVPFVLIMDNKEVIYSEYNNADVKVGYSVDSNSLSFNSCDSFEICRSIVGPNTTTRALVNILTALSGTAIIQDTSSFQYRAACWWIDDLEGRSIDDLKDITLIQRYILSLFYFSMSGHSWYNRDLWLKKSSVCEWYGISCYDANTGQKGVINEIKLVDNNLNGMIPTEIGALFGLEYLVLNTNKYLSGSIPKEIGNLNLLKELKCSDNMLSNCIPKEIKFLVNLLELDLSNNAFSGHIPSELAQAEKLNTFKAFGNKFYGTLPDISGLANLKELNLGNNFFRGKCESIKKLRNLEYLDLSNNFFDDELPISPGNQNKLKIIHLENNRFSGPLPIEIGLLKALQEILLYDNHLTGYLPSGIGMLTSLTTFSVSHNEIGGSMPEQMVHLNELELVHLHHNIIKGDAVNFQGKIKEYITDCGRTVSDEAFVTCEDCSICCITDGDCLRMSHTYPFKWLIQNFNFIKYLPAFSPILMLLLICILLLMVCITISMTKWSSNLPCIPFEVRSEFQADSVYKFLLTDSTFAWFVAILSGAIHIGILCMFVHSSDYTSGDSEQVYLYSCSRNSLECETEIMMSPQGIFLFGVILITFLGRDLVDGILILYESTIRCDKKGSFAGTFLIFLTSFSIVSSVLHNITTGISDTDIIKDAAILLFLNEIDECYLDILKCMFPSWVDKLEEEISSSIRKSATQSNSADDKKSRCEIACASSIQQSSTYHQQGLNVGLNNEQHPSMNLSLNQRNIKVDDLKSVSQAPDIANRDLMLKISEIQQHIDSLQMEVNRLTNQSLGALHNCKAKKTTRPEVANAEVLMSKINEIQQQINTLRIEINQVKNQIVEAIDVHNARRSVRHGYGEF